MDGIGLLVLVFGRAAKEGRGDTGYSQRRCRRISLYCLRLDHDELICGGGQGWMSQGGCGKRERLKHGAVESHVSLRGLIMTPRPG
jgi:hypothetical protein